MKAAKHLLNKFSEINPWWIVATGALLRTAFVMFFGMTNPDWSGQSLATGEGSQNVGVDGYVQLARTMLISGEYAFAPGEPAVAFRPPFVPYLMAAICAWSADHWYWLWMAYSVAAGTATLWVLWRCADSAAMAPTQTRILLLVIALHPYLIYSTRVPALPATLTLLITLILLAVIRFVKSAGAKPIALGCVWGLASLTHGSFLPLLFPFLATLLFVTGGPWLRRLCGVSIVLGISLAMVAPWTVRNYRTFGEIIPVASGGALQWWLGDAMYFHKVGKIKNAFIQVENNFEMKYGRPLNLIHGGVIYLEEDAILSGDAKSQIIADPVLPAKRLLLGLPMYWMTMDGGKTKAMIVGLMNLPLVCLYLVTLCAALVRRSADRIWLAGQVFFLGFWCMFAIIQAVGPYFLATMPLFVFLILRGCDHAFPKFFRRANHQPQTPQSVTSDPLPCISSKNP